jgi:ABC-type uncharacterized transport system permease subunit
MFQTLLVCVSLLFYVLATYSLMSRLFHADGINFQRVLFLACTAILSHLLLVFVEIYTPGGQDFSLINVVSLVCLVICAIVSVSAIKFPAPFLLTVVYGFAAFVQLTTLFFPKHVVVQSFLSNLPLTGHITLSLLAYCILIIATLYAIQFRYINNKLKSKDLSVVSSHFPPLMQVEKQLFQLLTIGTILLSAALITGFIYLDNMFSKTVAHKTVLSLIAWSIYTTLILGHRLKGWRGKNAVISTILGAFILTLAYFGSRFVKEIILGRL